MRKITEQDICAIDLFRDLAPAHRTALAAIAEERTADRGDVIFSDGDFADGFYVALSGQVRVYKVSPEGKEQILHIFGTGEPFGEVPVFTGGHFPATAEAMKKCRLVRFPRTAFVDLIMKDPSLALNMLAMLSKRLHRFTGLVENLSLKEVPGRLAAYLLSLRKTSVDGTTVELEISKGQLASLLGTTPETLSRILGKMTQQRLIRATGTRTITLVDTAMLELLASGEERLS